MYKIGTNRGVFPFSDVEWVRGLHDEARLEALEALKSWKRSKDRVARLRGPCERYNALKDLDVLAKYVRSRVCAYRAVRKQYEGIRDCYIKDLAA